MNCTWEDCLNEGEYKQIGMDGDTWAVLCKEHNEIMDGSLTDLKPKLVISNWIKAQGGAKKAAERMMK